MWKMQNQNLSGRRNYLHFSENGCPALPNTFWSKSNNTERERELRSFNQHTCIITYPRGLHVIHLGMAHLLKVSQGWNQGVSCTRDRIKGWGSTSKFTGCYQNSVPCGCRRDAPAVLLDITGSHSQPFEAAAKVLFTAWQFVPSRPAQKSNHRSK